MSHKIQIVLSDPQADQLAELAANAGEPRSTLAGLFVRTGIAQAAKDGKVRHPQQAPITIGAGSGDRARWLEPYGGDPAWRQEMWGQIVALHGRYPRALANLKDDWWTDEQHTEMLCALATWRSEIDDAGVDPRDELAFQTQLNDYAHTLRQEGGGVTKTWTPGAPPPDWAPTKTRTPYGSASSIQMLLTVRTWLGFLQDGFGPYQRDVREHGGAVLAG